MKRYFISFLLILFVYSAQSQETFQEWYRLGMKLKDSSNYDESIKAFEKASKLDKENSEVLYWIGWIQNDKEEYTKAIEVLKKAVKIKPNYAYALQEIAYAYKMALQINPKNGTAYKGIGDVYRRNYSPAKTTEAIENYKKAVDNNPSSAGSYFGLGWCYNELSDYETAIPYLKKAIALDKSISAAYTELGYAEYSKGRYEDAIKTFDQGLGISPNGDLSIYYKGLVYIAQKNKSKAQEMVTQLNTIGSSFAEKLSKKIDAL